ncbi:uncharacterized protein HKW66_Vig0230930 [Vigna angularis]|uniref:Uncharacterized protein n=1 Tax=Phaseolus angularis TaxID=3914 RepID=A0A8T0KBM6_PHAAN|nr:uncharacterized protein HKW66_Vig0230930 [Vigna angularis]
MLLYEMDFFVVLERLVIVFATVVVVASLVFGFNMCYQKDAMKWFQVKYESVILNKSSGVVRGLLGVASASGGAVGLAPGPARS